jgi:2-desacetyl-2-hydroxyethyl bacteriochlorophyllide A dehydrogenase
MKALVIQKPFSMTIEEWRKPVPADDEVLVQVTASGICAGDLYYYVGKNPYATYPQICGHEISGIVADTGKQVSHIKTGTAVAIEPFVACGHCYPCRIGKPNCCTNLSIIGVHRPGGYADFLTAPATHVHPIPGTLDTSLAALAEPITIALHAAHRAGLQKEEQVLIVGCGPIGIFCIEVAREMGAHVFASDTNPQRLEIAKELGATTLPADDTIIAQCLEHTRGEGFPVVIEATGVPAVMSSTVDMVAAGGRIVIAGLVKKGLGVTFEGLDFTRKELTILGTRTEVKCFPEAIRLLAENKIKFATMSTRIDMWQAPEIFAMLSEHPEKIHKGLLVRNSLF